MYNNKSVIEEYKQQVAKLSDSDINEIKETAQEYSLKLELGLLDKEDPFSSENDKENSSESYDDENKYYQQISVYDNVLGYIEIPKINVSLPIYNDTTAALLQKGACHVRETSLPMGGESTNCVLAGHTGLPGSMLFTDIDKLEIGDEFYLYVLNDTLAYKVVSIDIVEPSDSSKLNVVRNKDYCTLLTCTPYGINSHRLLVKGERTEKYVASDYDNENDSESNFIENVKNALNKNIYGTDIPYWVLILFVIFVLMLTITIIIIRRKNNKYYQ